MNSKSKRSLSTLLASAFLVAMTSLGGVALACPDGSCGMHKNFDVNTHITEMTSALKLTPDQQTKIRKILEDSKTKAESMKAGERSPEKREAFRKLYWDTEDAIYANLTCDQREVMRKKEREKHATMRAEHMKEHKDRAPHNKQ